MRKSRKSSKPRRGTRCKGLSSDILSTVAKRPDKLPQFAQPVAEEQPPQSGPVVAKASPRTESYLERSGGVPVPDWSTDYGHAHSDSPLFLPHRMRQPCRRASAGEASGNGYCSMSLPPMGCLANVSYSRRVGPDACAAEPPDAHWPSDSFHPLGSARRPSSHTIPDA